MNSTKTSYKLWTLGSFLLASLCSAGLASGENLPIRTFFLTFGYETPALWQSPIVTTFVDDTGRGRDLDPKVTALAQFYGMASGVETATPSSRPSIAYVVTDNIYDDLVTEPHRRIDRDLRERLAAAWEGYPVQEALSRPEFFITINGYRDGYDCAIFLKGEHVAEPILHFQMQSAVILASAELTNSEITRCFMNKAVLSFGFAISHFNFERRYDFIEEFVFYYGIYPTILHISDYCRFTDFPLKCIQIGHLSRFELFRNLIVPEDNEGYGLILDQIENDPTLDRTEPNLIGQADDYRAADLQSIEFSASIYLSFIQEAHFHSEQLSRIVSITVKFVEDEENPYHCSSALDPDSRLVVYASSTFNNEDTIQCAQHQVAVAAGLLSKDFAVEMDADKKNPVVAAGKYFSVTPFSLAIYSYCRSEEPNHTALCITNSFDELHNYYESFLNQ